MFGKLCGNNICDRKKEICFSKKTFLSSTFWSERIDQPQVLQRFKRWKKKIMERYFVERKIYKRKINQIAKKYKLRNLWIRCLVFLNLKIMRFRNTSY